MNDKKKVCIDECDYEKSLGIEPLNAHREYEICFGKYNEKCADYTKGYDKDKD